MEQLRLTTSTFRKVLSAITHLRPYAVLLSDGNRQDSILTPDFVVTNQGGKITVSSLQEKAPQLRIRKNYQALLVKHKKDSSPESKELATFIQDKMNRAKWFIQALKQRKKTLLNIMKAIVKLQRRFFETGDVYSLQPIFLRNVAEEIKMDISTVSRAVAHKAVQTDWQVYPLKYFFSEPIETKDSKQVSSRIIKKMLVELINAEDKTKPYTDEEVMHIFREKGFRLARRTIAKYRQQLDIPVARLRIDLIDAA